MKSLIVLFVISVISLNLTAQTLEQRLKQHIDTLSSAKFEGRKSGTKGDTLAAYYIRDEFRKITDLMLPVDDGLQNVAFTVENKDKKQVINSFNVVGIVKAQKRKNIDGQYVIIGAHYDHIGVNKDGSINYGADDNASGVAYVIELARRYAAMKNDLRYDMIFVAFTGEEMGWIGSTFYTEHPIAPLDKCKAMINFDMLGRMTNNGITIRGLGGSKEGVELLNSLKNKDRLDIIWEFKGVGATDYASFYLKGVPAFSFSTRIHKDYHSPADTPNKINYKGMLAADRYISQFIEMVLSKNNKLTFKDVYQ